MRRHCIVTAANAKKHMKIQQLPLLLLLGLAALAFGCRKPVTLTSKEFVDAFRSNRITQVEIFYEPHPTFLNQVRGRMVHPEVEGEVPFTARVRLTVELEEELLESEEVEVSVRTPRRLLW